MGGLHWYFNGKSLNLLKSVLKRYTVFFPLHGKIVSQFSRLTVTEMVIPLPPQ